MDDDANAAGRVGQRDLLTGSEHHRAQPGADDALVAHLRRQECDEPCFLRGQLTLVGDDSSAFGELVVAGQKVGIGDLHRTGHQPAHVNAGARTKDHAIVVQNEHLAVGGQLALDLRGIRGIDAVKDRRLAVGLGNVDRGLVADIKALPVDDRLLAALRDLHVGARLSNRHLASCDLCAGG